MIYQLKILGRPVSQKNTKRIGFRNGKPFPYNDDRVAAWKRNAMWQIAENWRDTKTLEGDLRCLIVVYLDKGQRMDADNAACAPLDAMQSAGCFVNDNQIKDLRVLMRRDADNPRIEISIEGQA